VTRRACGGFPNEVDAITVDPHGLAAVRKSLTSSSSNLTVREAIIKKKSKDLSPPPPSPPPRKSSQYFREETSSPKSVRKVSRPVLRSPSPERSAQSSASPRVDPAGMTSPTYNPNRSTPRQSFTAIFPLNPSQKPKALEGNLLLQQLCRPRSHNTLMETEQRQLHSSPSKANCTLNRQPRQQPSRRRARASSLLE
jgi:hypothetical protein